jgi:hypothetical protein
VPLHQKGGGSGGGDGGGGGASGAGSFGGPGPVSGRLGPHAVEFVVQVEVLLQEGTQPPLIPLPVRFAALFVEQAPHPGSFVASLLAARTCVLHKPGDA